MRARRAFPSCALPLLLLSLALLPTAHAHLGSGETIPPIEAGPYLAYLQTTTPAFEGHLVTIALQVFDAETNALQREVDATVDVHAPDGTRTAVPLANDGGGYLIGSFTPSEAGRHDLGITLHDRKRGEDHEARATLAVYLDLPFRIRPVDEAQDVTAGARTTLAFETVATPDMERHDFFDDLTVRVERWSPGHGTLLDAVDVQPTRVSTGIWRIEHVFPEPGMYHLRFASVGGGFNYDDVPLLHVDEVLPGSAPPENEAPAHGVVVAVAALALALGARRARPPRA